MCQVETTEWCVFDYTRKVPVQLIYKSFDFIIQTKLINSLYELFLLIYI